MLFHGSQVKSSQVKKVFQEGGSDHLLDTHVGSGVS